jgi:hypothetical protein
MPENDDRPPWRKHYMELLAYSAVGIEMGAAVLIGGLIGAAGDSRVFHGKYSPGFLLFFMAMGVAAAAKAFFRAAKEMREKTRDHDDHDADHQP